MKIFRSVKSAQQTFSKLRTKKIIAFVPTMGYLHEGHRSLIEIARKKSDVVVVSIFVNPLQFAPNEDYKKYPRDFKSDEKLCRTSGVNYFFYPSARALFPDGYKTHVNIENISEILEGKIRPGHFKGVATVVLKLFNIVQPHIAVFGQKDAQQLCVVRKLTEDLNLNIKILTGKIIREPDGLAMSSRNVYLNAEQRKDAPVLYKALNFAMRKLKRLPSPLFTPLDEVASGERGRGEVRDLDFLSHQMYKLIRSRPAVTKIDYISFNHPETLKTYKSINDIGKGEVLISLAVRFGSVRLIDNEIVKIQTKQKT